MAEGDRSNSESSRIDVPGIEPRNAPSEITNGETNRCKIFKVRDQTIHENSIDSFKPKILSIGPYHHGSSRLRGMETWKRDCRRYILGRISESYYDTVEIKELVKKARRVYSENITMELNKFADMLLLDGCFVLAFLTEIKGKSVENVPSETGMISGTPGTTSSDTTGHTGGGQWQDDRHQDEAIIREDTVRDLLFLVDNQIPFFVIEEIHKLAVGEGETTETLKRNIAKYVEGVLHHYPKAIAIPAICSNDFHHLLHLCHMFFRPSQKPEKRNGNRAAANQAMWHRAMQYREAGVEFRVKDSSTPHSLLDVTFSNGTMEIPHLSIDGKTESIFSNLLLFEKGCSHTGRHINAYVAFMSQLLSDADDVKLLARENIVRILNHEEEALNIFRRLNGLAIVDRCGKDYYLTSTFQSVEAHYRCRFNWWMAWLKHNHLTNPCVAVAALLGLTALLCTIIQQLLSILAHFKVVH
ncbi:UPF0481 protein [Ananas comosus]|uniref:UPF0481 protein n=1 Tax=Ananas comosus TaxID=4615 RepID=A0A199V5G8_ANACO|nr:UPF0481 protein [Ananas comosus]